LKAIVYTQYGGPGVLQLSEVPKPYPKDNEVLIRVHAVSLNDWDYELLKGVFINRLMNGLQKPKRQILGSDIAGRIEAVGKDVKQFRVGDEVYGDLSGRWGGLAEYVCAREDEVARKPAAMSFAEAAAIPQAGMLAAQALRDKGHLQPGQKLLVNGGGGGVGTFAVQIAKLYGVEVTGVDHTSKLELMRSIGYDHVVDYTKEDFTRSGRCYDLILDVKTSRSIPQLTRALCPNGMYVAVGGSMRRLLQALLLGPWISKVQKKRIGIVALRRNKDLLYMNELYEAGKLSPVIDGPYRLEEAPDAFRLFGSGKHKGKIVLLCEGEQGS
jgi:NADPH:quinone reductase-like Zn-dependent oxidoreductase